ncbi:uncharacterized protein PG998_004878 [Apiospora kogelbergensis]|uniref:uncharacterized protein n=1 Tax=Apiospora kogelbergensis TaxID=1337665 RepID=UPI00312D1180
MILYTLASGISLAIFALFALFVPVAESVESIGEWTVSSAQRIRSADNTICNWTFNIHGNSSIGDETDMTPIVCDFAAHSDPGRDCGLAAVTQVNCEGSDIWQANTGHSDMGFTVLVLVNQPLYSEAYYGFSDQDLDARNDIAAQTKSAYPIGAVKKRRLAETRDRAPSQSFAAKAQPEAWLVEDVIRNVNHAKTTVTMSFNIQDGSATGSICNLKLQSPKGVDASTWAWYSQKCDSSNYTVSWGYNSTGDAGIMTLVSPARDRNAYFGWDHVNQNANLDMKGPSLAIPCQC